MEKLFPDARSVFALIARTPVVKATQQLFKTLTYICCVCLPQQLSSADVLKGDSVNALATWGESSGSDNACDLSSLAGAGVDSVALRVAMVDAELFSLRVSCSSSTE